jgi:CRISPR system Cascade subunit CasC
MILELHLIQNFAPSNLNRSDTGSPKDCTFGGFRRARISSQCFKRAIRWDSNFQKVLQENGGSVRTRQMIVEIAKQITTDEIKLDVATKIVSEIFKEGGIERPEKGEEGEKGNTKLVFYMNGKTISEMAEKFKENWTNLTNKETKDDVIKLLGELLAKSVKAPDIALFGRMLEIDSKKPFGKINLGMLGSSQVAHAISTHKVGMEFDYFTAVDDLLETGQVGAGMIGTVEFNSACFYRYLNVDVDQLQKNLQGIEKEVSQSTKDLTKATVEAFIRSTIEAIPTGKQNSFATHERPNFVLAVVGDTGKCSLANAFATPAKKEEWNDQTKQMKVGLIQNSIEKLAVEWDTVAGVFGDSSKAKNLVKTTEADLKSLKDSQVANIETLISNTMTAIFA